MKIAVISDIHSNIYALEEVLKDINKRRIDNIICTGDLVGYGTRPNEVIDLIRKNKILTVMGNYDDAVGNNRIVCGCDYSNPEDTKNATLSMKFTTDNTTADNKMYLRSISKEVTINIDNKKIKFVHGSPSKINEYLKEDSIEAQQAMDNLEEDILVCGHTHIPYIKKYGAKILINAGSVGKPKTNSPNANYIIIDTFTEDIKNIEISFEIVEVEYDYEKAAKEIEKNDILPNKFAKFIRRGSK